MRLPASLLHRKPNAYKNQFGHVCVLAGSPGMMGAAALTSLAAMRCGAGLVTVGVPKSLNAVLQKKISPVVMTWPLAETKAQTLALSALTQIKQSFAKFDVFALGPGLSGHASTRRFIQGIVGLSPWPLVIDADALNALAGRLDILTKTKTLKVLTPHQGEMSRLIGIPVKRVEMDRSKIAQTVARKYNCVVLLKGHRTVVAAPGKKVYINKTGNPGMATAGSGDVLTGMIAAFIAQGLPGFEAARCAAYLHGRAGDLAAREKTSLAMIASDIIDEIPNALKSLH
jgi:NAD(P)H-hydrate epimerase